MAWLNANDYLGLELIVQDRLDDLRRRAVRADDGWVRLIGAGVAALGDLRAQIVSIIPYARASSGSM